MTGPSAFRARFIARVQSPRLNGWVEIDGKHLATVRAECQRAFRGLTVTLYERASDGFGYVRLGVVTEPTAAAVVDAAVVSVVVDP